MPLHHIAETVFNQLLFEQETEAVKKEIIDCGKGIKGECRARMAGCILDVTIEGYYNTTKCLPDFEKVHKVKKCP